MAWTTSGGGGVAAWSLEFTHLGKGVLDEQLASDHDDQHGQGTVLPAQYLRVGLPTRDMYGA